MLRFSVKPIMIQVLKLIWNCTSYRKPAKNKDDIFTKLKKQNRRNDSNGKRCAAKLKNRRERFMCYRWDKYWCKPCSKRFCFQKEMQPEIGNTASNNKFRKAAFHISIKQNPVSILAGRGWESKESLVINRIEGTRRKMKKGNQWIDTSQIDAKINW